MFDHFSWSVSSVRASVGMEKKSKAQIHFGANLLLLLLMATKLNRAMIQMRIDLKLQIELYIFSNH